MDTAINLSPSEFLVWYIRKLVLLLVGSANLTICSFSFTCITDYFASCPACYVADEIFLFELFHLTAVVEDILHQAMNRFRAQMTAGSCVAVLLRSFLMAIHSFGERWHFASNVTVDDMLTFCCGDTFRQDLVTNYGAVGITTKRRTGSLNIGLSLAIFNAAEKQHLQQSLRFLNFQPNRGSLPMVVEVLPGSYKEKILDTFSCDGLTFFDYCHVFQLYKGVRSVMMQTRTNSQTSIMLPPGFYESSIAICEDDGKRRTVQIQLTTTRTARRSHTLTTTPDLVSRALSHTAHLKRYKHQLARSKNKLKASRLAHTPKQHCPFKISMEKVVDHFMAVSRFLATLHWAPWRHVEIWRRLLVSMHFIRVRKLVDLSGQGEVMYAQLFGLTAKLGNFYKIVNELCRTAYQLDLHFAEFYSATETITENNVIYEECHQCLEDVGVTEGYLKGFDKLCVGIIDPIRGLNPTVLRGKIPCEIERFRRLERFFDRALPAVDDFQINLAVFLLEKPSYSNFEKIADECAAFASISLLYS